MAKLREAMVIPAWKSAKSAFRGLCEVERVMNTTTPHWGNYKQARIFSGLSIRLLQDFVSAGLIRSSVVVKPGARRGVRLIDLRSLDEFIQSGTGRKSDLVMNEARKPQAS